jgi:hypothetical protein
MTSGQVSTRFLFAIRRADREDASAVGRDPARQVPFRPASAATTSCDVSIRLRLRDPARRSRRRKRRR